MQCLPPPDISFIVPVYNAAPYIGDCLDSILAVPSSKEIIVIDDGSTDHAHHILNAYFSQNDCITLIRQPNRGVSAARNRGIALARGRYIQFVDADDMLHNQQYYPALIRMADERGVDVVKTMFATWLNGSLQASFLPVKYRFGAADAMFCSGADYFAAMLPFWFPVSWNGFIRSSLLHEHGVRYPEGFAVSEDALFMLDLLSCRPSVNVMDTRMVGYLYRLRGGSASTTVSSLKGFEQSAQICHLMLNRRRNPPAPPHPDAAHCRRWQVLSETAAAVLMIELYAKNHHLLSDEDKARVRHYFTPELMQLMNTYSNTPIKL